MQHRDLSWEKLLDAELKTLTDCICTTAGLIMGAMKDVQNLSTQWGRSDG